MVIAYMYKMVLHIFRVWYCNMLLHVVHIHQTDAFVPSLNPVEKLWCAFFHPLPYSCYHRRLMPQRQWT